MMAILLASAQAAGYPFPVAASPQLTLEQVTFDRVTYRCRVRNSNINSGTLDFELSGHRGYLAHSSEHLLSRVRSTPRKLSPTKDTQKILKNMELVEESDSGSFYKHHHYKFRNGSRTLGFFFSPSDKFEDGKSVNIFGLRVGDGENPGISPPSALGFCLVSKTPQLPLSQKETEEVLGK